jgi:hypothetical protein
MGEESVHILAKFFEVGRDAARERNQGFRQEAPRFARALGLLGRRVNCRARRERRTVRVERFAEVGRRSGRGGRANGAWLGEIAGGAPRPPESRRFIGGRARCNDLTRVRCFPSAVSSERLLERRPEIAETLRRWGRSESTGGSDLLRIFPFVVLVGALRGIRRL